MRMSEFEQETFPLDLMGGPEALLFPVQNDSRAALPAMPQRHFTQTAAGLRALSSFRGHVTAACVHSGRTPRFLDEQGPLRVGASRKR
jgi:hypothetical protein